MSPQVYLRGVRIQKALAMLETAQIPIKEVGLRCGFADPNYFARFFRKAIGISPRACRQGPRMG
jgi:AraC-like DNA-binding protein